MVLWSDKLEYPFGEENIQNDSGGKFNILGGYSVGYCEEKFSCEHVFTSEWLPRWSVLNPQIQKEL